MLIVTNAIILIIIIISSITYSHWKKAFKCYWVSHMINTFNVENNNFTELFLITENQDFLQQIEKMNLVATGKEPFSYVNKYTNRISLVDGNVKKRFSDILKSMNLTSEETNLFSKFQASYKDYYWLQTVALNSINSLEDPDGKYKTLFYNDPDMTYIGFQQKAVKPVNKEEVISNFYSKMDKYEKLTSDLKTFLLKIHGRLFSTAKTYYSLYLVVAFLGLCREIVTVYKNNKNQKKISQMTKTLYPLKLMLLAGIFITSLSRIHSVSTFVYQFSASRYSQWTSDLLTYSSRRYAITGNDNEFNHYWDIIDVRNGLLVWKTISKFFGRPEGKISLKEFLYERGLKQEEIDGFGLGESISNDLAWTETQSMNWRNKRWDKDNQAQQAFFSETNKEFIKFLGTYDDDKSKSDPNKPENPLKEAVSVLFSDEYIKKANMIREYNYNAEILIIKRNRYNMRLRNVQYFTVLFLLVVLVNSHLFIK